MPLQLRLRLITFSIFIILAGIFTFNCFKAMPSIGIMLLLAIALLQPISFKKITDYKALFSFTFIFLLFCISFLKTEPGNWEDLEKEFILKLPFLIFPFAFASLPAITERQFLGLYYCFLLIVFATAVGTLINYYLNFQEINQSYMASKVMPTPINHVRYSLAIALAIFTGAYLFYNKFYFKYEFERNIIVGISVFLFIFLHILSVRSGLLGMYFTVFILLAYLLKKGSKKIVIPVFLGLLLLPVLSYFVAPTFRNKVSNTIEDLKRINNDHSANDYSLAGRIVSYKVAWEIIKENPFTGIGQANLKSEVKQTYSEEFPQIEDDGTGILLPHNQFLLILASTGISGLIIFSVFFYAPLFINRNYRNPLISVPYVIITVSFLFEGTLETQTGSLIALVFIFLPLYHAKEKSISA